VFGENSEKEDDMSVLSNLEDYTKHYKEEHSWEDVLFALQVPIALSALAILFLLAL